MRLAVGLLVAFAVAAGFMVDAMAQVAAGRRVALVVGNAAYIESPLPNPINDARAMADALKQRGFTVILRENTSKLDLERAVADFGEQLQQGATGLFYYAGHGMQVNGRNFLIPVDARIPSEQRVRLEAVDVDVVLEQMQAARAAINLVILDACRNNPFEKRFRSAGGGGLAQINAPEGTLIAYATSPGSVAADGQGKHSLYTEELLKAMQAPGNKVEDVFKTVRIAVSRRSNGAQTPWEASSLTGDFYFVPSASGVAASVAPAPSDSAAPGPSVQTLDLAYWDSVKGSNNPAELQAYLTQFPNGTFAALARARIAALTAPAPVAAPVQPAPVQQQAALPPPQQPAPPVPQRSGPAAPAEGGYPTRPVTIVVPFAAGGAADITARSIAIAMGKSLRQPVIVENRAGAGGNIGGQYAAAAARDGYTLLLGTSATLAISPALGALPFDPNSAFTAIGGIARTALVLAVSPAVPARNATELVAYLKANSTRAIFASNGIGSQSGLTGGQFSLVAGVGGATHVPYMGTAPAIVDLSSDRTTFAFFDILSVAPQVSAGKLRALAIAAPQRDPSWPDLPTLAEQGIAGVESVTWYGLFAPAGLAPATVDTLSRALAEALRDGELVSRLQGLGMTPMALGAADMTRQASADRQRWRDVVARTGQRP